MRIKTTRISRCKSITEDNEGKENVSFLSIQVLKTISYHCIVTCTLLLHFLTISDHLEDPGI